jgi:hypothetical protein
MQPICEGFRKGDNKPCVNSVGEKHSFCDLPETFRCTEYIRHNEPTLSYSTIKDSICKRKLYHSYIQGIQLIVKPLPMKLGEIASNFIDYLHSSKHVESPNLDKLRDSEGNLPYQVMAMLGLFKGYKEKEFDTMKGITQSYFKWSEDGYPIIHGYMDLEIYDESIGYEFKYSARPDAYKSKFIIQDQISTYFMGNPSLKRITMRVIQVPQLKLSKNESLIDYRDRVYRDFLARPMYYIHDTSFWRNEFDYDQLREKYKMIASEIQRYIEMGGMKYFYQSNGPQTCFGEGTGKGISVCEYLKICESGVVSDQLYKKREAR